MMYIICNKNELYLQFVDDRKNTEMQREKFQFEIILLKQFFFISTDSKTGTFRIKLIRVSFT
jgi:hypothetical protein